IKELKPFVKVFYTTGGQATQIIRDGEADLVAVFTNRAQDAIKDGADYGIVTNQSIVDIDCYVIPKGSKHKDLAMKFIAGMVTPDMNGKIAEFTDVAPINQKSWPTISEARRKALTTNPDNKVRLVYLNQDWWGTNLDRLSQKYTAAISNSADVTARLPVSICSLAIVYAPSTATGFHNSILIVGEGG